MESSGALATRLSLVKVVQEQDLAPIKLFPELDQKALHGLSGDIVRAGAPTNVKPAGLLVAFLTQVATCFGDVGLRIAGKHYPARLFSVLAGSSSATKAASEHASQWNCRKYIEKTDSKGG